MTAPSAVELAREGLGLEERSVTADSITDEQIEPKEMSYQDRSEFTRLKHADVAQGKRIAELLGRLEQVEARKPPGFVATCDHAVLCDRGKLRGDLSETQRDLCETTLEVDRLRGRLEKVEQVVEAAREWVDSQCSRLADCDGQVGQHDVQCAKTTAEANLYGTITALDAVAGEGE
jgi:hypothetical protein